MARATASLVLGALTFAACEEVSVRDKSKVTSPQKDAGPDALGSTTASPPDDPASSACIALGASTCKASTDCCSVDLVGSAVECSPVGVCRTCKVPGGPCGNTDVCCSGTCNEATGKCPDECRVPGAACDNDGQCCPAADASARYECRSDKKCAKCLPTEAKCAASAECCRGLSCKRDGKCGACVPLNATGCSSNADCCAGSVCATDTDNPTITRCVAQCARQWSFGNNSETCKNAAAGFQNLPCCAPLKCTFDIPASEALGCGP